MEAGLIDIGAAAKDILDKIQISFEKKLKFKKDCKKMVLNVLLKFKERSPLKYSVLRNCSSLSPRNMVRSSEECSLQFTSLVDKFYVMKKITAPCADNAKDQFDKFLTAVKYEHKERFLKFKFKEDHLDKFLGLYVAGEDQFKDFWCVCKLVFILSHGQSNVERGFSVNKEVSTAQSSAQITGIAMNNLRHVTE